MAHWDEVATALRSRLNSWKVNWTSVDAVKIAYVEEKLSGPAIIWIGVMPGTLTFEKGAAIAANCRPIVDAYGITDYHVEVKESLVATLGNKFLDPLPFNPTFIHREPFTATLGTPIASRVMSKDVNEEEWVEGSGGFFLSAGGQNKNIYLITARHNVLPVGDENLEYVYEDDTKPRRDVIALGPMAFKRKLAVIEHAIATQQRAIDYANEDLHSLSRKCVIDPASSKARQVAQQALEEAKEALEKLEALHHEITVHWKNSADRSIGHLVWAPPIVLSTEPNQFTLDIAVIQIDPGMLDAENYLGNTINLSTNCTRDEFLDKVKLNPGNHLPFRFPRGSLFKLEGQVPEHDVHNLPMLDNKGEPCLVVFKNGAKTGITVGKANDVASYTRVYHQNLYQESREWAIITTNKNSGSFSCKGDSGSCVADVYGRVGGILTCGTTSIFNDKCDVTYVTPISFIMKTLRANPLFGQARLEPSLV